MNPEKIRVIELHYECRMCPMTLAGKTEDGSAIYARVRWGNLSVRIDPSPDAPNAGAEGDWVFEAVVGDGEFTGWIYYGELQELTKEIIVWPEDEPQ
jgi:hypothetical protein